MATHIREAKPKERERTKIEVHARLEKLIMNREVDRGQRSKQGFLIVCGYAEIEQQLIVETSLSLPLLGHL